MVAKIFRMYLCIPMQILELSDWLLGCSELFLCHYQSIMGGCQGVAVWFLNGS